MYEIIWTDTAKEEYHNNLLFWINHNKSNSYSLKIIDEVEHLESLLKENPYLGKITNNYKKLYKLLVLRHFYIYYEISHQIIRIISFKGISQGTTNPYGL